MKHFTFLVMALLSLMNAWATDYTGSMTISNGTDQMTKENVGMTVEQNADGTYTAVMNDLIISYGGYTYDIGTITFDNLTGTTDADGFTNVRGVKYIRLSDVGGIRESIPTWLQNYLGSALDKDIPINFTGRFNATQLTAHAEYVIDISVNIPFLGPYQVMNDTMTVDFYGTAPEIPEPPAVLGDVDGNDAVDVDDLNILINILLGNDDAANYDGRAEVNGNDNVDIEDVNALINIMLSH
ncbi:MAG: hypothetical protein IJT30_09545 [Muribaculaceae bacterium]|nr:hypothetical protein [Muribaculaceae bacterium]